MHAIEGEIGRAAIQHGHFVERGVGPNAPSIGGVVTAAAEQVEDGVEDHGFDLQYEYGPVQL